jgi:hypothetical protein
VNIARTDERFAFQRQPGEPLWQFSARVDTELRAPILDEEFLGRTVRETWIEWAREQSSPKPSWLTPWEGLTEPERDVDRRIGARLFLLGLRAGGGETA